MLDTAKNLGASSPTVAKKEWKPRIALNVDGKTLPEAYLRRIDVSGGQTFVRYKRDGKLNELTWAQFHDEILGTFAAFRKAGIVPGDKVCILSQTRPEWLMVDWAVMGTGAITVPIYYSNTVEDIAFIIDHSEAKLIFAEDEASCKRVAEAFAIMKRTIPVVSFMAKRLDLPAFSAVPYADFQIKEDGTEIQEAYRKSCGAVQPEQTASIVYTSGTTGQPKGAVLTHHNFASEIRSIAGELEVKTGDSTLTFLPFAHIVGRVESTLPIYSGVILNFAESINSVAADIQSLKPSLLVSVPRIFEKIFAKVQAEVQSAPEFRQKVFRWAVEVGRKVVNLKSEHKAVPIPLLAQYALADKLVFNKVRAKLGGRIRLSLSGGAPLSRDLCEFFHACGVMIVEAYGLTETTAAITTNRPDEYCFGTVGQPLPGVELQIAEDGEILVRGPMVFKEYYRNAEMTKEAFRAGGWFNTGDIGEINERGFLRITDRKKEIIVTSGGKNVAPQKLENLLKTRRLISNCMVYGDKQKYLSVLLTLNEPEVMKWADGAGIKYANYAELTKNPALLEMMEKEVKAVNGHLASFESMKKFQILPADFLVETGELTPSLKVKRKVVIKKFQSYIDKMYS